MYSVNRFIFTHLFVLFCVLNSVLSINNKYSKEANVKVRNIFDDDLKIRIEDSNKPFRMAKLNLLWVKAKLRLSEPKLVSLYSSLKLHDKEEIAYKHYIQGGGGDKDGLKEAELRKKLIGVMSSYDLLEHFEDLTDKKKLKENDANSEAYDKNVFKDKRLNKLWIKAEMAGFTSLELQVLREEFNHHQNKVEQYYSLLKEVENADQNSISEDVDRFNVIDRMEETNDIPNLQPQEHKLNDIRYRVREIQNGYDRLELLAARGPDSKEFIEPKVQGLWMLAIDGNFSRDELASLRTELHHYEKRLLKLRNLHLEYNVGKNGAGERKLVGEKAQYDDLEHEIKKQSRKVEQLHADLSSKIIRNEL